MSLTGFDKDTVLKSIEIAVKEHDSATKARIPQEYQIPDTSRRVLRLIAGTCKLSKNGLEIINVIVIIDYQVCLFNCKGYQK